jgi:hypothetical protein
MMMRKMLFGIVAGLLVFSVGVRAEDNDSADQKVAADKAKVESDIKAVNADKAKVKAAHADREDKQAGDDTKQHLAHHGFLRRRPGWPPSG